jgi:CubicO group peptidase (beta-lactamase class C family)
MQRIQILFVAILLSVLITACNNTKKTKNFPRSVPEAEGVSSQDILKFIEAVERSKNELHSFMFVRHGKVIAEGWWYPYRPDLKHTLYSTSKSFTSTAAGFAVSEKLFSVNDEVISFFPEYLPDTISDNLADMTVKDLLCMSAGQDPDATFIAGRDSNWIKGFLAHPVVNEPGTKFLYNSLATYMVSAIVQKVTDQKIMDYLTPRLFEPLGIKGMDWETDPIGINTGGWGLRLKTEDMAKFGQLYLQKGNWIGKQILPEEWIEEATTMKIEQAPDAPQAVKDSSDWLQGYCYQFWRCRHNAFRADGAYGQFIIIIPDQDAVIAITAETPDMQDEINLVWKYLLPSMHKEKLPANEDMATALKQKLSSLALPLPEKTNNPSLVAAISGKTFTMEPNQKQIENISFRFIEDQCQVTLKTDTATFDISFGSGKWQLGQTTKPGPYLLWYTKSNRVGLPPFQIAGSYFWQDEKTLELILRYIESPHTERMICQFDANTISVDIQDSFNYGTSHMILKGVTVK